jgi:O-antigen ligase
MKGIDCYMGKVSFLGVFVGFIVVVATSIVFSLLSLAIFSFMITEDAPLNILSISTGPLVYSLFIIFVAAITGILIASKIAGYSSWPNAVGVVVLYTLFSYWLSQSPSNIGKYPQWFVITSYILLIPSIFCGYYLSTKMSKNA